MRMLALETSSFTCSVATIDGGQVVAQQQSEAGTRTTKVLPPLIAEVLERTGWACKDLQTIAVTQGPGSFTGLRIGITTAKALAYAVGADVVGVNTLDVIAAQAPVQAASLWVVVNAHREQLFAGVYRRDDFGEWQQAEATTLIEQAAFPSLLATGNAVTGPGLKVLGEGLAASIGVVDKRDWDPVAATVGKVALAKLASSGVDDLWSLVPEYYRKSAAEEKLAGRQK